jgi:hypothetical protein
MRSNYSTDWAPWQAQIPRLCLTCGTPITDDDISEYQCNDCYLDMYLPCEDCGAVVLDAEAYYHDGYCLCAACETEAQRKYSLLAIAIEQEARLPRSPLTRLCGLLYRPITWAGHSSPQRSYLIHAAMDMLAALPCEPFLFGFERAARGRLALRHGIRRAARALLAILYMRAVYARHGIGGQRIRCYNNGGQWAEGGSIDQYTVVYIDQREQWTRDGWIYSAVAMNERPFHPQGFGQHCAAMDGPHLGKRIAFSALPADCQHMVRQDLQEDQYADA